MNYTDSDLGGSRFGALVRAFRHDAGLTQQELAAKAGLSVAALRDFEQNRRCRPRPSSLTALADALGLDLEQTASLARAAALPRHRRDAVASALPLQGGLAGMEDPVGRQGLWLAVLGPLEVWRDGMPLPLGPPARRTILGLLAMDPGVLMRRDTIVDVLWGESPPSTAVGLVQAHVSRLRRALAPRSPATNGEGMIHSVGGAYRLCLSSGELDLLLFRDLAARAAAARSAGDDVTACELYERAVGLCRGDPLADVDVLRGHPGVTLLRQQCNGVLLRYAELASARGEYRAVLPRLQALAAAEPYNESAHARLMIALAGSGQQAAAISVYEDLRLRLDRELGLYPGEELAEAHLRVLRQDFRGTDPGSAPGHQPAMVAASVPAVPRQLPATPQFFTGRAGELDTLSRLLERDAVEASRGMVIIALTGMAGIGKTALAVRWAHQVADQFPDGQLFVDLRGFSPSSNPVTPTDAICGFLAALGVPTALIPADADQQAALYRTMLAGRRMLIVLDNAQDAEQVRPLLPGSTGCVVLVTSRNRLIGLAAAEGAHLVSLGVLAEEDSCGLLTRYLGVKRLVTERAAVSELIVLCARLPLALCSAAARVAGHPSLSLAALAAEMQEQRGRLDALETGEPATSVRMVFSWSRARLSEPARHLFRLLGVYAGTEITVPAAASLAALPRNQAYLTLAELCDEHLLTEQVPGRYICHDLLRECAAEEARTCESSAELRAAVHRVLDHFLHTADTASSVLYPRYTRLVRDQPGSGVLPEEMTHPVQAAAWFDAERHVLLAAICQATEDGYAPHAWALPWVTGPFFKGTTYWRRLAAAQESALKVAATSGNLPGQALASYHLGLLKFWLGDCADACHQLDEAIELAGRLGDRKLCGLAGLARARALQSQNRTLEALVQVGQSLRLFQAARDHEGVVRALNALGWHMVRFGDHQKAAEYRSRARALRGKYTREVISSGAGFCTAGA